MQYKKQNTQYRTCYLRSFYFPAQDCAEARAYSIVIGRPVSPRRRKENMQTPHSRARAGWWIQT